MLAVSTVRAALGAAATLNCVVTAAAVGLPARSVAVQPEGVRSGRGNRDHREPQMVDIASRSRELGRLTYHVAGKQYFSGERPDGF